MIVLLQKKPILTSAYQTMEDVLRYAETLMMAIDVIALVVMSFLLINVHVMVSVVKSNSMLMVILV